MFKSAINSCLVYVLLYAWLAFASIEVKHLICTLGGVGGGKKCLVFINQICPDFNSPVGEKLDLSLFLEDHAISMQVHKDQGSGNGRRASGL